MSHHRAQRLDLRAAVVLGVCALFFSLLATPASMARGHGVGISTAHGVQCRDGATRADQPATSHKGDRQSGCPDCCRASAVAAVLPDRVFSVASAVGDVFVVRFAAVSESACDFVERAGVNGARAPPRISPNA